MTEYPIIGGASIAPDRLYRCLIAHNQRLTAAQNTAILYAYTTLGALTSIGNLYPFAQAVKETGWFASRRFVEANNVAGLGADDSGAWGHTFETIYHGVTAQYAHLLCYAKAPDELSKLQYTLSLLSPRRERLQRAYGLGVAQNDWQGLTHRWNTPKPEGANYARDIAALTRVISAY